MSLKKEEKTIQKNIKINCKSVANTFVKYNAKNLIDELYF